MAADAPGLVLLTADTVGGVWTYAVELAGALRAGGTRVAVASMGAPATADQRREIAALGPAVTLHDGAHRLEWMQDPWDDVGRAGEWLLDLARTLQPDVVHLNQYAFGALPFDAPRVVVAHSCVCSWWRAVHGTDAPAPWDAYRARVDAGLRGADVVVAPTAAMLAALRTCHRFDAPTAVIPNGRDVGRFRPGAKQPVILAAGRLWDGAKGLDALDRAAAAGLPWPVRVAGPLDHPEGGRHAARHVEALGTLAPDAMAASLASAAIYALPARYEPFGLSVLEAALAGCALVLGDIPSLRETWGGAARFVAPGDADGLRSTLEELALDDDGRLALATVSRRRALALTPPRMADEYRRVYVRAGRASRTGEVRACAS